MKSLDIQGSAKMTNKLDVKHSGEVVGLLVLFSAISFLAIVLTTKIKNRLSVLLRGLI